jgi:hypothetical protein
MRWSVALEIPVMRASSSWLRFASWRRRAISVLGSKRSRQAGVTCGTLSAPPKLGRRRR